MTDVHYLLASVALTWIMLMSASLARARAWTPSGLKIALGNRDEPLDPPAWVARADRAAKNMLENLVLFAAVFVAAKSAGGDAAEIGRGAAIFFWARVVYWAIYVAGIPYLRTAIWSVGVLGIGLVGLAAL